MTLKKSFWLLLALFILGLVVLLPGGLEQARAMRADTGSLKYYLVVLFLMAVSIAAAALLVLRQLDWPRKWLDGLQAKLPSWVSLALFWVIATGLAVWVTWFLAFTSYGNMVGYGNAVGINSQRWLLILGLLCLLANLTPRDSVRGFRWPVFLAGVVWLGSIVTLGDAFRTAVRYPFQLSWSEGNRMWDYSVLFGRRFYIYPPDKEIPAYIDWGRQSLWGLPFLLPKVTIQGVRLWSAVVFTIPYAIFGWLLFKSRRVDLWKTLFLGLWAFLFLHQGPIYTPLVLSAVLVVLAINVPLIPALLLLILSGYYAQLSRYTWLVAPAMWAGVFSLIQPCSPKVTTTVQRWVRAVSLGVAGLAGGFILPRLVTWATKLMYGASTVQGQGQIIEAEGVGGLLTRQPLLWDRLLPNSTFDLGILLALLLAAGPLVLLVNAWLLRREAWTAQPRWEAWLKKLALVGMQLAFLGVGLIISVKIGGGNNLHNLDMFLIGLLFLAGLVWISGGRRWLEDGPTPVWVNLLLLATIVVPLTPSLLTMRPLGFPAGDEIQETLQAVKSSAETAKDQGEVLFMDHRQLLTFGYVQGVPLVAEWEKKRMMDEAMANNAQYFHPFYLDITSHRFTLIISEPLHTYYQGEERQFGNENDAWVYWISRPLLCYYRPTATYQTEGLQLLAPRARPCQLLNAPDYSSFGQP